MSNDSSIKGSDQRVIDVLYRISTLAGKERNPLVALEGILDEVMNAFGASSASISLLNADSDKLAKERVEKLNAADSLVFQTEKQIVEYGDKIPAEKKEAIEKAVVDLKEAHKAEDMSAIDTHTETLNTAWQAASQDIYAATQEAGGAEGAGADTSTNAGGSEDEDVQDVEFEEVDEKG